MLANVHIGNSRERREVHTIAQLSFMLEKNRESENVSVIEALCFWLDIEVAQKLHFIYVWGREQETRLWCTCMTTMTAQLHE